MNALLVIGMALSGVATVFACVGLHKLYLLLQGCGWFVEPCEHGRRGGLNGGPCALCEHKSWMEHKRRTTEPSLPGAAEGGSTPSTPDKPSFPDDDFWDQIAEGGSREIRPILKHRPAHPDRPDEDW